MLVSACVFCKRSQFVSVGFRTSSQVGEGAGRPLLPGLCKGAKVTVGIALFGVHAVCREGAEPGGHSH